MDHFAVAVSSSVHRPTGTLRQLQLMAAVILVAVGPAYAFTGSSFWKEPPSSLPALCLRRDRTARVGEPSGRLNSPTPAAGLAGDPKHDVGGTWSPLAV